MTVSELSETFANLYPKDRKVATIFFPQSSDHDLTPTLKRNKYFIFQGRENYDVGLPLHIKYLNLVPQRFNFVAGAMPIVILDHDPSAQQPEIEHNRAQIRRTFQALHPSIRPDVHFFSKLTDVPRDWTLANLLPLDALRDHNTLNDVEVQYVLLTRQSLAESGIPTPTVTNVLQPTRMPEECCNNCTRTDVIAEQCTSKRKSWLKKQTDDVIAIIEKHKLPFVVKFNQTHSSGGVFLIDNEDQRKSLSSDMPASMRNILPKLTKDNEKLKPVNIVFTEMVKDIKDNYALTFFVQADGKCVWLCASQQHLDGELHYIGSSVVWSQQKQLRARFDPLMKQIGAHLHKNGYIGPVGADVLENATGKLYVVDLNVRPSASIVLGPLQAFFTKNGYDFATIAEVAVSLSRDEFEKTFADYFSRGRMVIIAWFETSSVSYGNVVLGACSINGLETMKQEFERYKPSKRQLENFDA